MKRSNWASVAATLLLVALAAHPAAAARRLLAKAPTQPPIANPPQFILFT